MTKYWFDINDFDELYEEWLGNDTVDCSEYIQSLGFNSCGFDEEYQQWFMTDESEFILFRLKYGT